MMRGRVADWFYRWAMGSKLEADTPQLGVLYLQEWE